MDAMPTAHHTAAVLMRCHACATLLGAVLTAACGRVAAEEPLVDAFVPVGDARQDEGAADADADSVADVVGDADASDLLDTTPCAAPAPTVAILVAPRGNDLTGNGSTACPVKTIARALKLVTPSLATVMLERGSVTSPNVYGSGCTGGPPCDHAVSTSGSPSVLLRGNGTRDEVIVRGGGSWVISMAGGGVEAMTIESTSTAPSSRALALSGFASPAPAFARDIRVRATSPAFGIEIGQGPTVIGGGAGAGVEVIGGERGIALRFGASATVLSTRTAPTSVRGTSHSCIDADDFPYAPRLSIVADADAPVIVSECGSYGIVLWTGATSSIDGVEMRRGADDGFIGIIAKSASLAVTNAKVVGVGAGIRVSGGSLSITGPVDVSKNYWGLDIDGARVLSDGLVANDCVTDGINCTNAAVFELRNSTVLGNGGSGVVVTGECDARLGGPGSGNVLNRTSHRNVRAGVCFQPYPKRDFSVTNAVWSCGHVGTTCASTASPIVTYTDVCELGADVSVRIGAAAPDLSGYSCCD